MIYNEYDNFSPYQKLMDGLKNNYKGLDAGKNTVFQFLPTPMDAAWDTGLDYDLYQKMDAVPAERGIYYMPGASAVSTAYLDLLDTLEEGKCVNNPEFMNLRAKKEKVYNLLATQLAPLRSRYMNEEGITQNTFKTRNLNAWIKECAQDGDAQAKQYLNTLNKEMGDTEDKMEKIKEKLAAPYVRAQNAYAENLHEYKDRLGNAMKLPYCSIDGEINKKVNDWDNNMEDQYEMTTTMKEDKTFEGDWEKLYNASFTSHWYATSISAGAELTRLIGNATYQITLKVKGIETFKINRANWYNDNFVKPDMEFVKGSMFTPNQFFGEAGSIQHIPTSLLVVYKPTIELTIDKKVYQERIYSKLGISSAAFFFGIPFSLSGGIDKHRVNSPDDHVKLVFQPGANDKPKIMGVTSVKKYL